MDCDGLIFSIKISLQSVVLVSSHKIGVAFEFESLQKSGGCEEILLAPCIFRRWR
jgi:hypothetical protein